MELVLTDSGETAMLPIPRMCRAASRRNASHDDHFRIESNQRGFIAGSLALWLKKEMLVNGIASAEWQ
jgi:hypothetical protein